MSTNAIIVVQDLENICLYKHWDGDANSTLPWLEEFNTTFAKERGNDPEYKLAQLVRSSSNDKEKFNLDPSTITGWGIGMTNSFQYEYKYVLKSDGSVVVEYN